MMSTGVMVVAVTLSLLRPAAFFRYAEKEAEGVRFSLTHQDVSSEEKKQF